jgi:hypothetical protein
VARRIVGILVAIAGVILLLFPVVALWPSLTGYHVIGLGVTGWKILIGCAAIGGAGLVGGAWIARGT